MPAAASGRRYRARWPTGCRSEAMQDPTLSRAQPHHDAEELIPWYLTGQLDDEDLAMVEHHLSSCAHCRRQLAAERRMIDEFAQLSPRNRFGLGEAETAHRRPAASRAPVGQASGAGGRAMGELEPSGDRHAGGRATRFRGRRRGHPPVPQPARLSNARLRARAVIGERDRDVPSGDHRSPIAGFAAIEWCFAR